MESALRKTRHAIAHSRPSRLGLVALLAFFVGACDATPPTAVTSSGRAASHSAAPACPATDLAGFVAAFAESPALQKAFTAPVVDTAFIDWSAQPEPAESVEKTPRDALRFPVMPNRARQQAEGLRYREIGTEGDRSTIALEVPDTDAQLRYTFRRDACWTLVKIVDPGFGKGFGGEAPVASVATAGRGSSLCRTDASVFSCRLKNGKQVAICVSGTDAVSLQYLYGTPAKIELRYPQKPDSAPVMRSRIPYSGATSGTAYSFRNAGFDYLVYSIVDGGPDRFEQHGMAVYRAGQNRPKRPISSSLCIEDSVDMEVPASIASRLDDVPSDTELERRGLPDVE